MQKDETNSVVNSGVFPANMCLEGHDQHSRWFLTSLVSSVSLTGQSPFIGIKTHGMLLNELGEKMAKSDFKQVQKLIDPDDLILGTVKMDGDRKHGQGLDAMRLWASSHDSDKNFYIEKEELEKSSKEVKLIRGLLRVLVGNLHSYDASKDPFEFSKLTLIDKVMACKLYKLSVQISEAYENNDLKEVYHLVQTFVASDVSEYYLPLAK